MLAQHNIIVYILIILIVSKLQTFILFIMNDFTVHYNILYSFFIRLALSQNSISLEQTTLKYKI